MRKDVRTGAAIGIIIIAVIVVYIIMAPKGHHSKTKTDNKVVLDTGKPTPAGDSTGGGDRVNTAEATTAAHEEHPDGSTTAGRGTVGGPGGIGTPVPGHMDDIAGPVPSSDAVPTENEKAWAARFATAEPARDNVEISTPPAGESASGHGTAVTNHGDEVNAHLPQNGVGHSPVPGGELTPPVRAGTSADSHISPYLPPERHVAAPAAVTLKSHRVAEGETFSSIARSVYGDQKYFKDIIKANPKVDPSHLKPGMTIMLPEKPQAAHEAAAARSATTGNAPQTDVVEGTRRRAATAVPAAVNASNEYRVQSGDSLYKISIKLYHTPNKQDAIYQLNKDSIGADPAKLKLGAILKLPEALTAAH